MNAALTTVKWQCVTKLVALFSLIYVNNFRFAQNGRSMQYILLLSYVSDILKLEMKNMLTNQFKKST